MDFTPWVLDLHFDGHRVTWNCRYSSDVGSVAMTFLLWFQAENVAFRRRDVEHLAVLTEQWKRFRNLRA